MTEKESIRLDNLKRFEQNLYDEGNKLICGIDEAGRGPLAGPVVVGAVVMKPDSKLEWVNDSKKVTEKRREILYDRIIEESLAWGVGIVSWDEIDDLNILNATKKGLTIALKQVVDKLQTKPDIVLVDAFISHEYTGIYNPASYYHLNFFANGLLTTAGGIEYLTNCIDYDINASYDSNSYNELIEKYGVYSYEELKDYISKEVYDAVPVKYLKIAVGKGLVTFEEAIEYIRMNVGEIDDYYSKN